MRAEWVRYFCGNTIEESLWLTYSGPGDILARVRSADLNRADESVRDGNVRHDELLTLPGAERAGYTVEVCSEVG